MSFKKTFSQFWRFSCFYEKLLLLVNYQILKSLEKFFTIIFVEIPNSVLRLSAFCCNPFPRIFFCYPLVRDLEAVAWHLPWMRRLAFPWTSSVKAVSQGQDRMTKATPKAGRGFLGREQQSRSKNEQLQQNSKATFSHHPLHSTLGK